MTEFYLLLPNIVEILIFSAIAYVTLLLLRGTRGIILLAAMMVPVALLGYIAYFTNMKALNTAATYVLTYFPLAIIIVFQHEIRRILQYIGSPKYFTNKRYINKRHQQDTINTFDEIIDCICALTKNKDWRMYIDNPNSNRFKSKLAKENIGALIAIEHQIGLNDHIEETGVPLQCHINSLLLQSIFWPSSPLHDGGVIIRGNEIIAAGCQFPASNTSNTETTHTRHNAALGLSENSDAIIIVVSEETGNVSVAIDGKLSQVDSPKELQTLLKKHFGLSDKSQNTFMISWWERLIQLLTNEANETNQPNEKNS